MTEAHAQIASSAPSVSFHTLGCRLNNTETDEIMNGLVKRGFQVLPFGSEKTDYTFINTCTVTNDADSSCRQIIRKAKRLSPDGKIIVAGCYAQMSPSEVAQIDGVDLVLGTQNKHLVFDYLAEELDQKIYTDMGSEFWEASQSSGVGHTRGFLKIQDGCNYVCSFCIIPFARGRSKAILPERALAIARQLVSEGKKEIVLTGVNIGEYSKTASYPLEKLIYDLSRTPGLERLRISSIEPNTMTNELLQICKESKTILPHFHFPLQSAVDDILKRMKRKYTFEFYRDLVFKVYEQYQGNVAIGADILTGLPGESEEYFQEGLQLIKDLPLTHFHVFPYSKRKNTLAAKMEGQVSYFEKKERVAKLRQLGDEKLQAFAEKLKQCHTPMDVLLETRHEEDNGKIYWKGYNQFFISVKVYVDSDQLHRDFNNQVVQINASDCLIDNGVYLSKMRS